MELCLRSSLPILQYGLLAIVVTISSLSLTWILRSTVGTSVVPWHRTDELLQRFLVARLIALAKCRCHVDTGAVGQTANWRCKIDGNNKLSSTSPPAYKPIHRNCFGHLNRHMSSNNNGNRLGKWYRSWWGLCK